jgi:F-type H+-transporting ATPase subunit O
VEGAIEGFNELVAQYKGELSTAVMPAALLPRDVLGRLGASLKQLQAGQKAKVLEVSNKVGSLRQPLSLFLLIVA